jgi:hypothetical protein
MCIMLMLVILLYSLDPVQEVPECEVQVEQAEKANPKPEPEPEPEREQGKTRCITPLSLTYILN